MKKTLLIITLFICFVAQSQTTIKNSSIDSGGATITNGTTSMLYSFGETAILEKNVGNISISEGFISSLLQLGITTNLKNYKKIDGVKISQDRVSNSINVSFATTGTYEITIFDALGKQMSKLTANKTNKLSLNVMNYTSGIYVLLIQNIGKKLFETHKIIIN